MASFAFAKMLRHADRPQTFPSKVLALASRDIRASKDETAVWCLAGTGWRAVLKEHRKKALGKLVGPFNTPKTAQVNDLFKNLIGISKLSLQWHWKGMTSQQACASRKVAK